jgi:hypothetical protein
MENGTKTLATGGALLFGFAAAFLPDDHRQLLWLFVWTPVALLAFVVWTTLDPRAHRTSHRDELRADAAWMRREHPSVYVTILDQPGGSAAAAAGRGHADEFVASWLGELDRRARRKGDRAVLSEWRMPA